MARARLERRGSSMALVAGEDRAEVSKVENPQLLGAADEATEGSEPDSGRKIERGSGDGSDGNSLLQDAVGIDQGPRVVDANRAAPLAG